MGPGYLSGVSNCVTKLQVFASGLRIDCSLPSSHQALMGAIVDVHDQLHLQR
ncbi:hypothetical protein F442_06239 [Phytophthora nicotianae P10297]|uniref:Uncharacterized protein n=3 Tax=Phytophthora nicotianae TaxID=4792 RepID=W2PAI9_PHYN3|nr:hypothetical protein PPTG_24734 [Phytophthora nicotianae INRA-310]ETI50604.1 hypothetical protein F443_05879 [Phytophthora nicotianae P1569]ETM98067.1 hypothetical protein PPTG_24734 [Phytophthora nicotianae INRA-310]ETP47887.1 hypothetical protein F442_06239 [Phytophthora nicotianae P10297]